MASSRGIAANTIRVADMEKMSVEQLRALKEQSDLEVNLLQDSLNKIRTAATRLEIAFTALHDLSLRPQGKKMLVPLTASLYVKGTLDDAEKVLIDVGTGYFVEKTMVEGKDYCDRKINLLKSNYDELVEIVLECLAAVQMIVQSNFYIAVVYDSRHHLVLKFRVASKKKSIADELGLVLQAKLRQSFPKS